MAEEVNTNSAPAPAPVPGQIKLGPKLYTTGTVPGPVPPEYMDTENLRAAQRAAREAGQPPPDLGSKEDYIAGTAPMIAPPPVAGQTSAVPKTNLGGLPRWSSVIQDKQFRGRAVPEQHKVREKWLRTIADLNPQYSADEIRELRKAVYQSQAEPLPILDRIAGAIPEPVKKGAVMAAGSLPVVGPMVAAGTMGAAAKDILSGIPKPDKPTGVTAAEAIIGTQIPGITQTQLPSWAEQAPKEKGYLDKLYETYEKGGVKAVAKQEGWHALEEAMKKLEQIQFSSSWFFGGLEGKIAKEREIARKEGRMRYLRELPDNERYKIYEQVMFSDGYTGVDERIADTIRNDFMPAGLTVQEIDRAVVQGIKQKKFPEQAFYHFGPKKYDVRKKDSTAPLDPYAAIGYMVDKGINMEAANDAMWRNLHYDIREIKDASTLRKLNKGKTYEEKYGFWKGLAMNVLLTTAGDPITWGTLMTAAPLIATKTAASGIAQRVSYALSGRATLSETLKAVGELLSKGGKQTEELRPWLKLIIEEAKRDVKYAGKDKAKAVEELDKLMQQAPVTKEAQAGAKKIEDTAREAGIDVDAWWKNLANLPAEGTVPVGKKEALAQVNLAAIPVEGTVPISREAAEKIAKGTIEPPPSKGVVAATAPTDILGVSRAAESIIPEEARALREAATRAGQVKEGVVDMSAKIAADKAAEEAASAAERSKMLKSVGNIPEGVAPGVTAATRATQGVISEVPRAAGEMPVGAFGRFNLPEVGKDGISKVDDAVEAALEESEKRIGISSVAPETPAEDMRIAREMGNTAEETRLSKLRTHDIDTRRKFIKMMQEYEDVLRDARTTPIQREKYLERLQSEWQKIHPDDFGNAELQRVMAERSAMRTGVMFDNPTGSDLVYRMGDDWTSQWKPPKKMTPSEAYEKTTFEQRQKDRELLEAAMKEFEAEGGKVSKVAPRVEQEPRIVGEKQWNEAREQALMDEGIEIFSGDEQVGHISQRLGGEWDEYKDSLKYAVESGKAAVSNLNIRGIRDAAQKGWAGFTEQKGKMLEKIASDELLSGKDKAQLKKFFDKADEAVKSEIKTPGRKARDPIENELRKVEEFYANTVKRNAARKSPITAKKMDDGSIKVSRIQHGQKVDSFFTPPEHNDGEFLGSIFGMAQKFWEDRTIRKAGAGARKGAITESENLKKSLFSIEKQFENFPIVGKAVKNMYSTMDAVKERAMEDMVAIAKEGKTGRFALKPGGTRHKLTNKDLQTIPLLHEDSKLFDALPPAEQERLRPLLARVQKFYDDFQKMYKDRGADVDFKAHYQQGLVDSNKKIDELLAGLEKGTVNYVGKKDFASLGVYDLPEGFNGASKAKVARLLERAKENNTAAAREMDSFKYINIPYAMWFDSSFDRAAAVKAMKLANAQKRETFRIADLIASGAIKGEQVDLFDMMAAYSHRASKDIAMLDIRNAMGKEGVYKSFDDLKKLAPDVKKTEIGKLKDNGWKRMDPRHFPFFSRGWMHPAMQEWLYNFKYERLNANTFDKVLSSVKVWQFANPFFLPYYDIMQGAVARGPLGMINPVGWGRDMYAALKMYKNKSPLYWELLHEGLDSKPMAMPFDEWSGKIQRLKGETGLEFLAKYGKDSAKSLGLKPIYEGSWFVAWELDKIVRLATSNLFIRKGWNVADAAKMSALLHSDYANVPVATRRALNRVLFTGTFKITMFRLYKDMMKQMMRVPYKYMTGKGKELTNIEKNLAKSGYTTILAGMMGFDLFMTANGYERDQFARRYFKPVMTEKGPKEDVVVFSNPMTMVPKYWQTIRKLANENYKDDRMGDIVNEFKYDIHPVYRIGLDILNNKRPNGDPIWEPFVDTGAMKWAKNADYAAMQVFQIFKQIGMEQQPEDQQRAWELFRDEWGPVASYLMKPTSFQYLRDPSTLRYVKDLQRMQRAFQNQLNDMAEDQKYEPEKVQRMARELQRRSEKIVDLIRKAEQINDRNTIERWKGGVSK